MKGIFAYLSIWAVGVAAACGNVRGGLPDPDADPGPGSGSGPGGPGPAMRGPVRVTVLDPSGSGAPAVGASVVFIDPDGALVRRASTDTAGRASADVLPGASATAVISFGSVYEVTTVMAIEPGDDIAIGYRERASGAAGKFTVSYPTYNGAISYAIAHPCGVAVVGGAVGTPPPTSTTITFDRQCKLDAMELVVTPRDGNARPLAALGAAGIAFVDGGSTSLAGPYQPVPALTATYTNVGPRIETLSLTREAPDEYGFNTGNSVQAPGTGATLVISAPPATGAALTTRFARAPSSQVIRQRLSGAATTYGVDVGAMLLPWLTQPSYDDVARALVVPTDTAGTTGAQPDALRVVATYQRRDNNGGEVIVTWTVYAAAPGNLALPTLPPEVGPIAPVNKDDVSVAATMFEADTVAGYDAVRGDPAGMFRRYQGDEPRPPADTVRVSHYTVRGPR